MSLRSDGTCPPSPWSTQRACSRCLFCNKGSSSSPQLANKQRTSQPLRTPLVLFLLLLLLATLSVSTAAPPATAIVALPTLLEKQALRRRPKEGSCGVYAHSLLMNFEHSPFSKHTTILPVVRVDISIKTLAPASNCNGMFLTLAFGGVTKNSA